MSILLRNSFEFTNPALPERQCSAEKQSPNQAPLMGSQRLTANSQRPTANG